MINLTKAPFFLVKEDIEWVENTKKGIVAGPNSWDGYVAAATAEAFIKSRKEGMPVKIDIEPRPEFYK